MRKKVEKCPSCGKRANKIKEKARIESHGILVRKQPYGCRSCKKVWNA